MKYHIAYVIAWTIWIFRRFIHVVPSLHRPTVYIFKHFTSTTPTSKSLPETQPKKRETRPPQGPDTKTLLQKRPALKQRRKKHNKTTHIHSRKIPHHRICNHTQSNTQSHNICNLSNTHLSRHEISSLNKGLSFIPKPKKTNPLELYSDILSFVRKLRLQYIFHDKPRKDNLSNQNQSTTQA